MGRKKKAQEAYQKPWCYYCDREFDGEGILVQHQKAKHFTCQVQRCKKRCSTSTSLAGHAWHVHQTTLTEVPNAIEGRNDLPKNGGHEVIGMMGIPPGVLTPLERRIEAAQEEESRIREEAERVAAEAAAAEADARRRSAYQARLPVETEAPVAGTKRPAAQAWGGGFSLGAKKEKKSGLFESDPLELAGNADSSADSNADSNTNNGSGGWGEGGGLGGWDGAGGDDALSGVLPISSAPLAPREGSRWDGGDDAVVEAQTDTPVNITNIAGGTGMNEAAEMAAAVEKAQKERRYKGIVKVYNKAKGFGFITFIPDDADAAVSVAPGAVLQNREDVYVHRSGLITHGYGELEERLRVIFGVLVQPDGRKVCRSSPINDPSACPPG